MVSENLTFKVWGHGGHKKQPFVLLYLTFALWWLSLNLVSGPDAFQKMSNQESFSLLCNLFSISSKKTFSVGQFYLYGYWPIFLWLLQSVLRERCFWLHNKKFCQTLHKKERVSIDSLWGTYMTRSYSERRFWSYLYSIVKKKSHLIHHKKRSFYLLIRVLKEIQLSGKRI